MKRDESDTSSPTMDADEVLDLAEAICAAAAPVIALIGWRRPDAANIANEPDGAVDDALQAYAKTGIRIPDPIRAKARRYVDSMDYNPDLQKRMNAALSIV